MGWKCIVLTTDEGDYHQKDYDLNKYIHGTTTVTRVKNPNASERLYKWCSRIDSRLYAIISKLPLIWRLGNVLSKSTRMLFRPIIRLLSIPDALIGILPKFVRQGHKIIRSEKPDIIFATSPPPTTLITGLILGKFHNVPWVADLRDEWSLNPYMHYPNGFYKWLDQVFEKHTLTRANRVITTTPQITKDTALQVGSTLSLFSTITNGHNLVNKSFKTIVSSSVNKPLTLLHSGILLTERSPESLIKAFEEVVRDDPLDSPRLVLHFAGNVGPHKAVLQHPLVKQHGYLSHPKLIDLIEQSDVLVLIAGENEKRSYAGKIFEYLAAGKPLLIICPFDSATFKLFDSINPHVYLADINDSQSIKKHLLTILRLSDNEQLPAFFDRPEAKKYHRKQQAIELHNLFLEVLNDKCT